MTEFIDKDREATRKYYDIMNGLTEDNTDETFHLLTEMIHEDPDYLDPYLVLAEILGEMDMNEESEHMIEMAYERAIDLITAETGSWPDRLEWGWMQNRHIIRSLINMGILSWRKGENDDALEIFQKLLASNPNDNGGVRYFILGILEGMTEKKFDRKFFSDPYTDSEIDNWFNAKSKKHDRYFKKWREILGDAH